MGAQESSALHMRVDGKSPDYRYPHEFDASEDDSGALKHTLLEGLLGKCLRNSDPELWADFVHHARPLIAAVITKHLRRNGAPDLSAADDLIQETYLKLCGNDFRVLRNFVSRHNGALHGFLKVIARNVVLDHARDIGCQKRGRGKIDCLDELSIAKAARQNGNDSVEHKMLLAKIEDFVATATCKTNSRRDYTIFWLYYRQGLCARLIAQSPGINLSVKGVESAILRLTRQIREKFHPEWTGGRHVKTSQCSIQIKTSQCFAGNKRYAI